MRHYIIICLMFTLLGGCYSKPVRHLASDASMIKTGESTREEVLQYLGEPNGRRSLGPGVEEYLYHEDRRNILQRSPVIGSMLDGEGYEMLIITLTGDIVTDSEFRTFRKGELHRFDGFSWDEDE